MNYYLINNTIKKGTEMPSKTTIEDKIKYTKWYYNLQPCEISESELEKIIEYLLKGKSSLFLYASNPIDVTDVVYEKLEIVKEVGKSTSWVKKIYLKQPSDNNGVVTFKEKEIPYAAPFINDIMTKQVKNDLHNHKDWDLAYHFYRLGRFEEREGVFQKHFKEYLLIKLEQPKQVDEIEAVKGKQHFEDLEDI